MAGCFRCEVVRQRTGEAVGGCLTCGSFACREDGDRDAVNVDFICGMCQSARLMGSAVGPPPPPRRPPGGPASPTSPDDSPDPQGSGGFIPFSSSDEYESRCPKVAARSIEHRSKFKGEMDYLIPTLREKATGGLAEAMADIRADELDPRKVAGTMRLLWTQIDKRIERGTFDPDLLGDALGVATWSIGVGPGVEPEKSQLDLLADSRLQVAIARLQRMYA